MSRRSSAFGIAIEADVPAPGLPLAPPDGRVPTRIALAGAAELGSRWGDGPAERLLEERVPGEAAPARTIDHRAGTGYRLYARGFGLALVADDGLTIACTPPEAAPWDWQRFLVGRVLPWAALLRGMEPFHASAVELGGRALAIGGGTGWGKTSLAARLLLAGARFVTDDVLALDVLDGMVRAHPGAALLAVRAAERATLPEAAWAPLGPVLGREDKIYVQPDRVPGPLPLAAFYVLMPADGGPAIEPVPAPDPRMLLGGTFIASVRTPERLRGQLDVCARLAATVPVFRVRVERAAGAGPLAAALAAHARATVHP